MDQIAQLITNYGFSTILLAWMLFKDFKFNQGISTVLGEIKEVLAQLRATHNKGE